MSKNKFAFTGGWLVANLVGWSVGIVACFFQGREILTILYNVPSLARVPGAIGSIFSLIWLPLSLALGLMQGVHLANRKISPLEWTLATVAGWGIPSLLFSFMRSRSIFESSVEDLSPIQNYYKLMWGFLLVVGACVGFFQYLAMRKSMTEPAYWIAANAFGLFVFSLLLYWILPLAFDSYNVLLFPWIFLCLLPFLAVVVTAIPTGWVLLQYGRNGK